MTDNGLTPEQEQLLRSLFDELNARHFAGELPPPKFMSNKLGGYLGFYVPVVHLISLHPRTLQQDRKYVADSLLHELLHYALALRTGDHDKDHGQAFVSLANEIGESLQLPAIRVNEPTVLEWPQSVRPPGYAPWQGPR